VLDGAGDGVLSLLHPFEAAFVHVAIIGNGITGVSAALSVRELRPEWRITLISGESTYHYSRPALMYVYMGHMRYADTKPYEDSFWIKRRIDLLRRWVTKIDLQHKRLELHQDNPLDYDKLLLATGSKTRRFGWPGQDLGGVQGLYGLMDLHRLHENTQACREAVIVGGGLIGIELAEMLRSQGIRVTFLVREESYWNNVLPLEESRMINEVVRERGIRLLLQTELARIEDDGCGRVGAVVTTKGQRIRCQLVGLTTGVQPNLDLVKETSIATARGILADTSFRTNAADVYAAGDCAEIESAEGPQNLLQQVWYTGRSQGRIAGQVIAGEDRRYDPGIWYNSAKFFELEYQTYGRVDFDVGKERSLFWRHPARRHAIRIVHEDAHVTGFNFMGLRFRHQCAREWIAEGRDPAYVLAHLVDGSFLPELSRSVAEEALPVLRAQLDERVLT
jgi:NADPH-dependent 2,4-dienoyl-CoA reductase/sulfur reductase-like enzyme